jgi:predicted transcriptional regulator
MEAIMELVNINIHAEGEYTGLTYDENIVITKESYDKLQDEISKMRCYIENLNGEYSETLADINVTFPEKPSKTINDGDILLYKLEDLFKDNNMIFMCDYIKVLFGDC